MKLTVIVWFDDLELQHDNVHHPSRHFLFFFTPRIATKGSQLDKATRTWDRWWRHCPSGKNLPLNPSYGRMRMPIFTILPLSKVNATHKLRKFNEIDRHCWKSNYAPTIDWKMWDPHLWPHRGEIGGNVKWRTGMSNCQSRTGANSYDIWAVHLRPIYVGAHD